ncbi:lipoyltransferase 1, mitochondrial-like isoform X2 [Cylas formicarius]|nr:lipoyltransferase 1, mitochondrial-like isoform X2 [Cylas formicarius]
MMNLCEENTKVTIPLVMKAIGWEFMRTTALTMKDGGQELANKQNGFQMINPTENWFPGLKEIQDYYTSWDWCYGNTPKFHITQSFPVPGGLIHNTSGTCADVKVTMTVESGKISDITLFVPEGFSSFGFTGEAKVVTGLKGKRFSINAFNELENSLDSLLDEKERFVTECVRQVMTSA